MTCNVSSGTVNPWWSIFLCATLKYIVTFTYYCVCVVWQAGVRRAGGRVVTDVELVQDEVETQLSFCQCRRQFPAVRLAEGKYRVCTVHCVLVNTTRSSAVAETARVTIGAVIAVDR